MTTTTPNEISAGFKLGAEYWLFSNNVTKGAFKCADPRRAAVATYVGAPWLDIEDIEAAASHDNVTIICGSHSAGKSGRRPATEKMYIINGASVNAWDSLIQAITPNTSTVATTLRQSIGKRPDYNGFNIEGCALQAVPGGGHNLHLGFRTPLVGNLAPMITIPNAQDLRRGIPSPYLEYWWLDMGGRGVRDMLFHRGTLYVLAGPGVTAPKKGSKFQLRGFTDNTHTPTGFIYNLGDGPHWECLLPSVDGNSLVVISDAASGAATCEVRVV